MVKHNQSNLYPKNTPNLTKIKFIFDKPIIIADNIDKNQIVCLSTLSINELYNLKNIELLKEELNNTLGIDLIKTDIKLPVIEFSEYDLNGNKDID